MRKFELKYDKKLDAEVCNDILALKEKCVKAYNFTTEEKHQFYWNVMFALSRIIEEKERKNRKEKKMTPVRKTQIVVASKKKKTKPEKKKVVRRCI